MWLSYHEQEHYNSVRLASDFGTGPPEPIRLSPDGAGPAPAEAAEQQDSGQTEERVMQGTGCRNAGSVRQALCDAGGDVDQVELGSVHCLNPAFVTDFVQALVRPLIPIYSLTHGHYIVAALHLDRLCARV